MNDNQNLKIKNIFLIINVLFIALLSGQIFYLFIGLFLVQSGNLDGIPGLNMIYMFLTPTVVLFSILSSKFIYSKQVSAFDKTTSLESKLISYRTNNIIRLALLEGANIFSISIMIITASYLFAALSSIILFFFLFNRPNREKFIMDYEISANDALKIIE